MDKTLAYASGGDSSRVATLASGGEVRAGLPSGILFFGALDQLDLVAFRGVDKRNSAALCRMWSVRQRMTLCRGVFGELVQILDFKCEMRQIGTDHNRPTTIEFTDLNFLIAVWCFQEDEL